MAQIKKAWIVEDHSLVNFYADLIEFIHRCFRFCFNFDESSGMIPFYENFQYPLKCLLMIHEFLYYDEIEKERKEKEEREKEEEIKR